MRVTGIGRGDAQLFSDILAGAKALGPELSAIRRDIHAYPEVGFQEQRTAALIASKLAEFGIDYLSGVAETGVVATLEGSEPGWTVLLRADMDALPIAEETGLMFASTESEVEQLQTGRPRLYSVPQPARQ